MTNQRLAGPGKKRDPRLKWTIELRLGLLLLKDDFALTWADVTTTFNLIFRGYISSCGVSHAGKSALTWQYAERQLARWTAVHNAPAPQRQAIKTRISNWLQSRGVAVPYATGSQSGAHLPPLSPPSPVLTTSPAPSTPTQSTLTRKRGRPRLNLQRFAFGDNDGDNDEDAPRPAKRARPITRSATVVISKAERRRAVHDLNLASPLVTPKTGGRSVTRRPVSTPQKRRSLALVKSPKTPRNQRTDLVPFTLLDDRVIMLTPRERDKLEEVLRHPPVAPTYDVAHPHLSLLFRYWDDTCQSPLNEKRGFTAGAFAPTSVSPPPPPDLDSPYFPWTYIATHIDRKKVTSPFISTSNDFAWVLRLALDLAKKGALNGKISVIDPAKMDLKSIFHAQPFHRELCKRKVFEKGAWLYKGMHEFLVYANVPSQAIIHTFPLQAVLAFAVQDLVVGEIFRLDTLRTASRMSFTTKTLPLLKQGGLRLSPRVISALANVCHFLHLTTTHVAAISSLISDTIQGFGLNLEYKAPGQWRASATTFAKAICSASGSANLPIKDHETLKWAFLDGVRWSCGEFNARQKPNHIATMISRSKKIGLEFPAKILTDELDVAKMSLMLHEKRQQRLCQGSASRALLAEADEDDMQITGEEDYVQIRGGGEEENDDEDEEEIVVSPNRVEVLFASDSDSDSDEEDNEDGIEVSSGWDEESIVYESEDSDEGSLYESDSEGSVFEL